MSISQIIAPREASLAGDLKVRRALPYRARRMVGPFTFLDEMTPYNAGPGKDGDVPAHPHIGLSTLTYLFEGEIVHRDNLGSVRTILPGDVNWMTAGRGIVHSERLSPEFRSRRGRLHGLQAWVSLPLEDEEAEPSFRHYASDSIPRFHMGQVDVHLIAGSAFGCKSPVQTSSELHYFSVKSPPGGMLDFDPGNHETALYLISGSVEIDEKEVTAPALVLFEREMTIQLRARSASLGVFLGGVPLAGERFIDWNFVSSSRERIERAKADWRAQKYERIPGESDFVPLP